MWVGSPPCAPKCVCGRRTWATNHGRRVDSTWRDQGCCKRVDGRDGQDGDWDDGGPPWSPRNPELLCVWCFGVCGRATALGFAVWLTMSVDDADTVSIVT